AVQQTRRRRRELWLAGLRPTAPRFELEARRNARKRREETVQFAADVLPLARHEGHDRDTLHLAHAPDVSTFGCPGPNPSRCTACPWVCAAATAGRQHWPVGIRRSHLRWRVCAQSCHSIERRTSSKADIPFAAPG